MPVNNKNIILNLIPRLVPTEGDYAVEIEAEGRHLPANINGWNRHNDPSLKAGQETAEYVMDGPKSLEGVKEALKEVDRTYVLSGTKVLDSQTSGVHIHVNVQQFTPKQMFTFIVTYFALEELLLKFCGEHREGNHFCLRAKDAEFIIHELSRSARTRKLSNLNTNNLRYCSLNPVSLFKYGSLENRAMRGTGNIDEITKWVEIIDQVKRSSLQFGSPDEVVRTMSMGGVRAFVQTILKDKADFFLNITHYKDIVKEGVRIIQPLAYAVDWDEYKDVKINPFRQEV